MKLFKSYFNPLINLIMIRSNTNLFPEREDDIPSAMWDETKSGDNMNTDPYPTYVTPNQKLNTTLPPNK